MPRQHKSELVLTAKDKTRATLKGVENNFSRLDGIVGKFGIGLGSLAGATGFGAIITAQARGAKQALTYADALNVPIERLTAMQFAFNEVGIGSDKTGDILKDVAEKIGDAFRNGGGEAKEALDSLNLSIEDMARLSPDQQLLEIGKALATVGTQGEKIQVLEALGNDAALLLPLLDDNARELERLIDLSDETGNTLTRIEAEKLNEVNKATKALSAEFEGLTQELTVRAAPALTDFINLIRTEIPKAVNFAQPAFDGIGRDIFNLWELLNPSDVSSSTGLEEALARQSKLADDLSFAQHVGNEIAIEDLKKQLDRQNLLVDSLERQKKILEENDLRASLPVPEALTFTPTVGSVGPRDADSDAEAKANDKLSRQMEREAKRLEALRAQQAEALQNEFAQLGDSLKSEEQLIAESHLTRQQIINEAELAGIESIIPFNDLRLQLAEDHERQLTEITVRNLKARDKFQLLSAKNQTKQVLGELVNLTAGVAQHNKALFNINKVAGIAQATINTYEGVSKTLSAYPQPLAGILAATHLAAGLATVDAISSTSFGGGGSAPSLAGSGGGSETINTVPVNPQGQQDQQAPRELVITIAGDGPFRDMVVQAIESADADDEIRIVSNG